MNNSSINENLEQNKRFFCDFLFDSIQVNLVLFREMLGEVLIYSIAGCPHCIALKARLNELNLSFTEVQLDLYEQSVRDDVKKMTGSATGK